MIRHIITVIEIVTIHICTENIYIYIYITISKISEIAMLWSPISLFYPALEYEKEIDYTMINDMIQRQGFLPTAVCLLCVDQIIIDDPYCRFPDCVYPLYPKHLIFFLERFWDTFLFGKLLYQPREHFLRLLIQIGKVVVELPAEKQAVV